VRDEVAHKRVFERVNDVRHIHDLLLPMIVIDTQLREEYKVVKRHFADSPLQSGLKRIVTYWGCAVTVVLGCSFVIKERGQIYAEAVKKMD